MRPIIGIPCFAAERAGTLRPIFGNNQAYVRAIEQAGGAPVLLPLLESPASMEAIRERLDGLLLSGGGDLAPALYGEEQMLECGEIEVERDAAEIDLTRWALEVGMPVLGVCRGMQLLNVVRGGTLYQDIVTQHPGSPRHDVTEHGRTHRAHAIAINPRSRLAAIMGTREPVVNSLHHQAVKEPGEGVEIVGWSEDGIAEALELPGYPFVLAVQYHPEELYPTDEASRRLFAAFVRACAK
ncbi:MAG TPA: gamma-glutamyl-gamma-aminobutyrate hydrolase family protein [Ktedonobacterales bacterium]|nr:gamma-glutamyl-gamma-aminobutyrate hydrolase family protein [Ktedonobacterales bacterium]